MATTVTIFPDETKDLAKLDIVLPDLTAAHEIQPKLEGLSIDDVRNAFRPYKPLPLGKAMAADIEYEGRALITGELPVSMNAAQFEATDLYIRHDFRVVPDSPGMRTGLCQQSNLSPQDRTGNWKMRAEWAP